MAVVAMVMTIGYELIYLFIEISRYRDIEISRYEDTKRRYEGEGQKVAVKS